MGRGVYFANYMQGPFYLLQTFEIIILSPYVYMYEYVYMYLSLENLHIYMNFHGYGQITHRFCDVGFAFPFYVYYKEGK